MFGAETGLNPNGPFPDENHPKPPLTSRHSTLGYPGVETLWESYIIATILKLGGREAFVIGDARPFLLRL